jgi:predicted enzyme related to lactoylglutathione lyase
MNAAPKYPPGTPMWIDLTSPDLQASVRFYGGLFGWEGKDQGEEAGHYTIFYKDGKMVAAVTPPMNPGTPPSWTTYVATEDASASAAKAREAGGQVLMDAFQVMDAGTMAVLQDPAGAVIAVWQPGRHQGAELANEPGSFTWNELQTRDMEAAKRFYPRVFGWGIKENPMNGGSYVEWTLDGRSIAGGMTMAPTIPANVPPFWLVYFAVEDTDAAVAKAQQLGGQTMMAAMDSPAGRFAVVNDPQGAVFAVIKIQR